MALGTWFESSDTDYYYGNAAASSGVAISRTDTEATARAASFDSGALLPEVIILTLGLTMMVELVHRREQHFQ